MNRLVTLVMIFLSIIAITSCQYFKHIAHATNATTTSATTPFTLRIYNENWRTILESFQENNPDFLKLHLVMTLSQSPDNPSLYAGTYYELGVQGIHTFSITITDDQAEFSPTNFLAHPQLNQKIKAIFRLAMQNVPIPQSYLLHNN